MPTCIALNPHLEAFVREQVKLQALRRAVAAGVASIDDDEFTVVELQDVGAFVSGLGARASAGPWHRRGGRKGGGA